MHDYLRAVGFSKVQHKRDLQRLLDMVMGSPDSEFASSCGGGLPYAEKCRDFVSNAGITVRGEVDEHGMFSYEYYFPHYTGHQISLTDDISVEKISEREEYDGLCDVVNLGVSLIFHMNQPAAAGAFFGIDVSDQGGSSSRRVGFPVRRGFAMKQRAERAGRAKGRAISLPRSREAVGRPVAKCPTGTGKAVVGSMGKAFPSVRAIMLFFTCR